MQWSGSVKEEPLGAGVLVKYKMMMEDFEEV